MPKTCSGALGCRLRPSPPYLSGARCFLSQLRSSSVGLVSARGLVLCRSETPARPRHSLVSSLLLCLPASCPAQVFYAAWHAARDSRPTQLHNGSAGGSAEPGLGRGVSQLPVPFTSSPGITPSARLLSWPLRPCAPDPITTQAFPVAASTPMPTPALCLRRAFHLSKPHSLKGPLQSHLSTKPLPEKAPRMPVHPSRGALIPPESWTRTALQPSPG